MLYSEISRVISEIIARDQQNLFPCCGARTFGEHVQACNADRMRDASRVLTLVADKGRNVAHHVLSLGVFPALQVSDADLCARYGITQAGLDALRASHDRSTPDQLWGDADRRGVI